MVTLNIEPQRISFNHKSKPKFFKNSACLGFVPKQALSSPYLLAKLGVYGIWCKTYKKMLLQIISGEKML